MAQPPHPYLTLARPSLDPHLSLRSPPAPRHTHRPIPISLSSPPSRCFPHRKREEQSLALLPPLDLSLHSLPRARPPLSLPRASLCSTKPRSCLLAIPVARAPEERSSSSSRKPRPPLRSRPTILRPGLLPRLLAMAACHSSQQGAALRRRARAPCFLPPWRPASRASAEAVFPAHKPSGRRVAIFQRPRRLPAHACPLLVSCESPSSRSWRPSWLFSARMLLLFRRPPLR